MSRFRTSASLLVLCLGVVLVLAACARKEFKMVPISDEAKAAVEAATQQEAPPTVAKTWEGDSLTTTSLNIWKEGTPEYRALWITRFEWPQKDAEKCKEKIIEIFDNMKAANFNTAVFQIRGEAETLYPSEKEPWSYLFDYKDPGFDPVAFAIEEAHKRGIEFHAYINPIPMVLTRDEAFPPPQTTPEHIFHKHGPDSDEPWVCMDENGQPSGRGAGYVYLSPGVPEVQAYLRDVIMDVVRRYDVDGIHLDRIRYPGRQYSQDHVSKRRYFEGGNPNRREWADWQREQLSKFINDLRAEIVAEKPELIFSASVWGIYSRHDIEGYERFSSGYHDYYQDSWEWVRLGAMDVLFPMIYWNIPNPTPNYHELFDVFVKNVGREHLVGGQTVYRGRNPLAENLEQILYTRNSEALGTCLFAYGAMARNNGFEILKNSLYQNPVDTPTKKLKEAPETGAILGRVLDENGNPLTDARVSLTAVDGGREARRSPAFNQSWPSGSDGRFAFNAIPPSSVRVEVEYMGLPVVSSEAIAIIAGEVAQVDITIPGSSAHRDNVFFKIFSPESGMTTSEEFTHLLGRTNPANLIQINGGVVDVYGTGGFALDNIRLAMGENKISIVAYAPDGRSTEQIITVTREEPRPPSLTQQQARAAEPEASGTASKAPTDNNPWIVEVTNDGAGLTWGLHDVRLGGPYAAEAPAGTQLVATGKEGDNLKISLSADQLAWISERSVKQIEGASAPRAWFTSANISSEEPYDIVAIGLNAPVLITASCETYPRNVIYLDFYNTHYAATWLSHKSGAQIVGPVSGEQVADGHVRLTVPVSTKQIWGYWLERTESAVKLYVKRPPRLSNDPKFPFKGLYIAVEAGHGGSNTGARGTMGQLEKTVNRDATDVLAATLTKMGATVIQTRIGDEAVSLQKRTQRAIEAEADIFVSMHSNAASTARGFLRVSGTSTYYKHAHSQLAASLVYDELLKLGWGEFGVVGNFNYSPLRMSNMPSILVEQAFMSNPYDEARLIDPAYQADQAQAIARGLANFLAAARE